MGHNDLCREVAEVSMRQKMRRFSQGYQRFVERQGFAVVMTACIGVIVLTAVWSGRGEETLPTPTPPVDQAQVVAGLQQQSLAEVMTPTPSPSPSPSPERYLWPTESRRVLRAFDVTRMQPSAVTGLWQVHDGVDLQAEAGDPVAAMADGQVLEVTEEGLQGAVVVVDHGEVVATYAGMALTAGLRAGDPVEAGQTLGFAGEGMVEESDLPAHVHLSVLRDGQAVDPMLLLRE